MPRLIECVPNVSEGRNRKIIDALADAIGSVPGVTLLDVDPGADTNRTVYTFVGEPAAVADAAVALATRVHDLIDLSAHHGAHPRIGALDVCPFVPVSEATMDECVALAREAGGRIADALDVPVYFYEYAASSEARRSLAAIRTGEYEGLAAKLADPAWRPDRGPARFDPRFGATVVGARDFLVAYNVNLNTRDRRLANEIALDIRENGRLRRDAQGAVVVNAQGEQERQPGRLKAVRAIGWYIDAYRQAQVSINLLNFHETPLHVVFDTVCEEAARRGLRVTGSELVGMIPRQPLLDAGRHYLRRQGKSAGAPEPEVVEIAVRTLGLDQLAPFEAAKKVIEYRVATPGRLVSLQVARFADEVSSDTPAPGGGSVAALAGALGAALVAMVGGLTVGKKGYEDAWTALDAVATEAQAVKARLVAAVDADTVAFDRVMAATTLPKATPGQAAERAAAIEAATRGATEVPLATARDAFRALELCEHVASRGNRNSASDAGVGALVARAALEGAVLNVRTNVTGLADRAFAERALGECDALVAAAAAVAERVSAAVDRAMRPAAL